MIYTLAIMVIGLLVLEIFAGSFSKLFGLSGETEMLCVSAMRVISISFVFAGANIAFQGIFQALDSGIESLVVSVCRQLLFVLPLAWVFSLIAGMDNIGLVWSAFPITEFVTAVIALIFMRRIRKNKINLPEG